MKHKETGHEEAGILGNGFGADDGRGLSRHGEDRRQCQHDAWRHRQHPGPRAGLVHKHGRRLAVHSGPPLRWRVPYLLATFYRGLKILKQDAVHYLVQRLLAFITPEKIQ
jgi:hypothetical protein